jgi:hypothetical protein
MAAKHKIVAETTNDYNQKGYDCSCGAHVDDFEAHLLGAHRAELAKTERDAAIKAANEWNKA